MDIYQTEDEQVEALKKWWEENGKSAVFGVVLGLVAIFGWREFKDYRVEQTENASQLYQQMVIGLRDSDAESVAKIAADLQANHASTSYAVFADLGLAKLAIADNKPDEAVSHLQSALKKNSHDALRDIISLRLVRAYIASDKLDSALAVIKKNRSDNAFKVNYQELEGDIYKMQGDFQKARDTYQTALNAAGESGQDTIVIDMKLNDLGRKDG